MLLPGGLRSGRGSSRRGRPALPARRGCPDEHLLGRMARSICRRRGPHPMRSPVCRVAPPGRRAPTRLAARGRCGGVDAVFPENEVRDPKRSARGKSAAGGSARG